MKKQLLVLMTLLGSGAVLADTTSFDLDSEVTEVCNVTSSASGINITAAEDQLVAELNVECNIPGALKMSFSSASGVLSSDSSPQDLPYTLDVSSNSTYRVQPPTIENTALPFTHNLDNSSGDFLLPKQFQVYINVETPEIGGIFAGEYHDDVAVEITGS